MFAAKRASAVSSRIAEAGKIRKAIGHARVASSAATRSALPAAMSTKIGTTRRGQASRSWPRMGRRRWPTPRMSVVRKPTVSACRVAPR